MLLVHYHREHRRSITDADLAIAIGIGSFRLEVSGDKADKVVENGRHIADSDVAVAVRIAQDEDFRPQRDGASD